MTVSTAVAALLHSVLLIPPAVASEGCLLSVVLNLKLSGLTIALLTR